MGVLGVLGGLRDLGDRTTLFINKLAYFLDEFLLVALLIAVVLVNDVALAVNDDGVRYHLDAEGALEVAVRVEKHVVRPFVAVNEGAHLVDVLRLVDRHGDDFHAGLLLPLLVDFVDGVKLTVARMAPCGEEVDDERLAVVRQRVGADCLAVDVLQCYRRELGVGCANAAKQHYD